MTFVSLMIFKRTDFLLDLWRLLYFEYVYDRHNTTSSKPLSC